MEETKLTEIMGLKHNSLEELKIKYAELFGQEPTSNNKVFLWRKIAHRLQELEHGALSENANNRIHTLIQQFDPINNKALRPVNDKGTQIKKRDMRLPIPGTVITKEYKGQTIEVRVLDGGFEFKGKTYKSLTAIAKEITGAHWNGFLFFNL
jgi:hypothetical protein